MLGVGPIFKKKLLFSDHEVGRLVGEDVVVRLDADVDLVVALTAVLPDVAAMDLRKVFNE